MWIFGALHTVIIFCKSFEIWQHAKSTVLEVPLSEFPVKNDFLDHKVLCIQFLLHVYNLVHTNGSH